MDHRADIPGQWRVLGRAVSGPPVRTEVAGRVLRITLARPAVGNALDWESLEALSSALVRLDADEELWVGVLTGSGGKAFCVGADLKKLPGQAAAHAQRGIPVPSTLLSGHVPVKPVVCAMNGDALGGGLELALGCDLRLAADHASMGLPEAVWSLVPAGSGTWRLPHAVGSSRALALMLQGTTISAATACSWGLLCAVVPADRLEEETAAVVERILRCGPLATRAIKRLVADASTTSLPVAIRAEQAALAALQATRDAQEGIAAFAERRVPAWAAR